MSSRGTQSTGSQQREEKIDENGMGDDPVWYGNGELGHMVKSNDRKRFENQWATWRNLEHWIRRADVTTMEQCATDWCHGG